MYINKKLVGQTPLTLRDQPVDRALKVELRLAGYKTQTKRIKWHSKLNLAVLVQLHPEEEAGSESESAPPAAEGGDSGATPKSGNK